jgi:hypothetical protein
MKVQVLNNVDAPLCKSCITNKCQLSQKFGYFVKCNNITNMKYKNGICICINHYKFLQKFCYVCGEPKKSHDKLSYDNLYYCPEHKPVEQCEIIHRVLKNKLNSDCISMLVKMMG